LTGSVLKARTLAEWNYLCVNFYIFAASSNEMQGNSNMQMKMELTVGDQSLKI
jgi:hypothetical protein